MRAITPMKDDLARKIRATAASVDKTHPETVAAQHLRNAATLVQHGQGDGAKRHLDAAMELMTPRNLMRHGITDDEGHATAKTAMHQMNVHRLGVMDIQDAQARNSKEADAKKQASDQQTAAKQAAAAAKQQATTPPPPASGSGQQNSGPGQQSQPPASPPGKQPAGGNQQGQQASAASNTWPTPILAQSFSNVDLSAKTAMLESTPAPYGKPGGPGLYGKASNKHSDYFEQIVTALMTKRGMDKATASKIAWGALRKWRAGGGGVHPEVQAAAAGALVKEAAAGARAALAGSTSAVELSWKDAWKTEDRGKGGQWVGELSGAVRDLAKSGDLDNSEASDHLRKAADAIDAQDQDTARQHLTAAYSAVAAPLRGKGNESDYQHRAARGTLNQIRGHLNAINDLPRSPQDHSNWDTIDRLIELSCQVPKDHAGQARLLAGKLAAIELAWDGWRTEPRDAHGRWTSVGGGLASAAASGLIANTDDPAAERQRIAENTRQADLAVVRAQAQIDAARKVKQLSGQQAKQMHMMMSAVRSANERISTAQAREDTHQHRLKLALHVGVIAAGAVLSAVTMGVGAPIAVTAAAGVAPNVITELIDWAKGL